MGALIYAFVAMTAPRSFEDLSKPEARELLKTYVDGLPRRTQAFIDEVRRKGGPAARLDYSRDSLVPAWEWLVATRQFPSQPVDDATMWASDPPWWYEFYPDWGMTFGPDLAHLVTNLAAYVGMTATRQLPDARWKLGTSRRYSYFQQPMFAVERGTPKRSFNWAIEDTLCIFVLRLRSPHAPESGSDHLQDHYDTMTGRWAELVMPSMPVLEYALDALDEPGDGLTHEISLDDVVAHEQAPRVGRFVKLLSALPGITEVLHPDRDTILLGVAGSGDDALRAAVASVWADAKKA